MAWPKVMFGRALAEFKNGIKCDVVQLSMKNYSSSGLGKIICMYTQVRFSSNKSQQSKGLLPGTWEHTVNFLTKELLINVEYQNRLRTKFAVLSFEMEVSQGYQVTRRREDHEM